VSHIALAIFTQLSFLDSHIAPSSFAMPNISKSQYLVILCITFLPYHTQISDNHQKILFNHSKYLTITWSLTFKNITYPIVI
jgi:hypothetical protein